MDGWRQEGLVVGSTLKALGALGARISEDFAQTQFDEEGFPGLAARALAAFDLGRSTSPSELLQLVARLPAPSGDVPAPFGTQAFTVYEDARFCVQVCLWHEASASLRDLPFRGAFQTVGARCLYATHEFTLDRLVSDTFALGHVRPAHSEALDSGAIRAFEGGLGRGHALFQLQTPAVLLLVRTRSRDTRSRRYDYCPPFVAFTDRSPSSELVSHALAALKRCSPTRYQVTLSSNLERGDLEDTFRMWFAHERSAVLDDIDDMLTSNVLCEAACARFPKEASLFEACFEEVARVRLLHERLERTSNEDHRFLLAALSLAQDRSQLLSFVSSRYPGCRATERIGATVREMIHPRSVERELRIVERGADAMYLAGLLLEEGRDEFTERLIASGDEAVPPALSEEQIDESYAKLKAARAVSLFDTRPNVVQKNEA